MKMYLFAMPFVVVAYHWLLSQKVSDLIADFQFLRGARMELIRRQQQQLATMNPPAPPQHPPVA